MNFGGKISLLLVSVLAVEALEANRHQIAFECGYNAGADAARDFYACGQGNFGNDWAVREAQERAFGGFMWQHTRQQRDNMRNQRRQRRGSDAERYTAEHAWDIYNCHHQQRIVRTDSSIHRHFRTYEDVRYLFATLGCLSESMHINYDFTQGRYQPVQEFQEWFRQHPRRVDVLGCLGQMDHVARDAYGNVAFVPRTVHNCYNCDGHYNNYNCSSNHEGDYYFNPNPFAGYQQVQFAYGCYACGFNRGEGEPFSFECSAQQGFDEGWNVMQCYYIQLGCAAMRNHGYNCNDPYNYGENEWVVRNRGLRQWRQQQQQQRRPGLRRENSSDRLNDLARASDAYGCVHARNIFDACRSVRQHCRTYEDFCRFYDTLGCLMDRLEVRFDNLRQSAQRQRTYDSGTFPLVQSTRTWMQQHAQVGLSRDVLECAWGTDHAATNRYGETIFENYPLDNLGCSPFNNYFCYYNNYRNYGYFGCDEYNSDNEDDDFGNW